MVCGDANYCSVRQKTYSDDHIKRTNRCRDFELNPLDALRINSKGYRPRKQKETESDQIKGQITLIDWLWELENSRKE